MRNDLIIDGNYILILNADQLKLVREYCDYHHISILIRDVGPEEFYVTVEDEATKDRIVSIFK